MSSGEYGQTGGAGRLLAGRYRVLAPLGRGGMGVVWRAVDEVLGREVAVKELRTYTDAAGPELAGLRLRMQREARAAARVRHPGVVAVHDIAEVDGRPLIVMELVDGPSLDDVLRERGTLGPREAAGIGVKVMEALAAAHRAGVLHRDVKPGNILLDRSGRVVLTDFGIATMDDPGDGSATHLTRSGEIVGSLDYLAPERAQGGEPGPASDIWALGATLYAAVEGASPFRRTSTYSTLTAIVSEPLPESRRAGPLAPVLRQLMDKQPAARPDAERGRGLLEAVAQAPDRNLPTASPYGGPGDGPARAETQRAVPSVPPGFGPPQGPPAGQGHGAPADQGHGGTTVPGHGGHATHGYGGPGAQGYGAPGVPGAQGQPFPGASGPGTPAAPGHGHGAPPVRAHGPTGAVGAPGGASAVTGPMAAGIPPRRKGRVLLAAAAVTVVLVATGVTVALLSSPSGVPRAGTRPTAPVASSASAAPSATGRADTGRPSGPKPPSGRGEDGPAATAAGSKGRTAQPTAEDTPRGPSPSRTAAAGGSGGSGDGGTTGSGGGTTAPALACHPIGGGKYNCQVWSTAKSYTAAGAEAGVLHAGTNYFYCQANLGRRETSGEWTNVWWAKTDDDSGNADVWVSDVYIQGGDNDAPVPGLPVC
ncbi:protein kinase [Streptomyces pharetrae]|uniref:serine/threonine-protein kinase n=1 Tax=Streptomyces pharetrae TaxID=291370 RepID=UPI003460B00A